MKTIELYYLIKELNYYEENIIIIIKYYYEFELEFIKKFKQYIFYPYSIYHHTYEFIWNYNKYKNIKLFLHSLTKNNIVCFHMNVHYNINDEDDSKLKIFRYNLSFYEIVKAVILYHKKNRTNTNPINFENIKYQTILDILLERNGIYKKKITSDF